MYRWIATATACLLICPVSDAQTAQQSESATIAQCLRDVQQHSDRQEDAARKAGQKPDIRTYAAEAREMARRCAARFKLQDIDGADLQAFALLEMEAGNNTGARAAIARRLEESKLNEIDRAEALNIAVTVLTRTVPSEEDLRLAENYTAQLDQLSDATVKQKIGAHKRLGGFYNANETEEEKLLAHDVAVLDLVKRVPLADRENLARQNLSIYGRIAASYGNLGLIEKGRKACQEGKTEALRQKRDESVIGYARCEDHFSVLGRSAAPLKAAYWLNAPSEMRELEMGGRVTVIQFTAHWCAPCRKSYPDLIKLYDQYKSRGLEVLMSTRFYGYLGGRQDLKPEDELAADREYYLEHHKLPFKIAVEPQIDPGLKDAASDQIWRESNEGRYFVAAFPQHVIVDKRGIVRRILTGWGPANEKRVVQLVEQLLREP